jgi:hypothetical protein
MTNDLILSRRFTFLLVSNFAVEPHIHAPFKVISVLASIYLASRFFNRRARFTTGREARTISKLVGPPFWNHRHMFGPRLIRCLLILNLRIISVMVVRRLYLLTHLRGKSCWWLERWRCIVRRIVWRRRHTHIFAQSRGIMLILKETIFFSFPTLILAWTWLSSVVISQLIKRVFVTLLIFIWLIILIGRDILVLVCPSISPCTTFFKTNS